MYSAAYLFLKRFYLNEIVYLLFYIAYYLVQYLFHWLQQLASLRPYASGSETQLIDYLLDASDGDRYGLREFAYWPL